ncbi:putative F-box domain, leucine-rich repeat domain superfamily, F-box-like domain superfamily [Helianthus annuus]|uniref:F-box domain, leucine-rich repeat domain superfamily, F-box-like domain superfamily n=1 Tax=Helianthus annuus TaxID=4232 RepID=A0A9K3HPX5_HELAN|nr:putative F-box domain, leucine-rich repeat domain superfamily, F-box-like domain superfamily [Helianthus annuus]KAJ0501835.1 putative F-box domain-containing protein [Helianthus annuus]KAJ0509755.1 putative F-box domain, leucine-rich repeat domain superfamily, F-box-like domain superfamily [Helianthus annuus]KAJ0517762.1 putative F-box domain-containing protein [Helianthus annuus]KAJ0685779.1 putative F-box domain-containing protein [Helianthus annuus]
MDSRCGKIRMNVEGDRLSSLPDDLILKTLSFIDTKHAIRTSVLSSRWKYIWTSTPRLDFSTRDFRTLAKFSKFVTGVLSIWPKESNRRVFSRAHFTWKG